MGAFYYLTSPYIQNRRPFGAAVLAALKIYFYRLVLCGSHRIHIKVVPESLDQEK